MKSDQTTKKRGNGRAEIKYNGMVLKDIDSKVREALRPQLNGGNA